VQLLADAERVIRPLARLKRHSVELRVSKSMAASPRKITARKSTVAEIIENLLHNAIKYSLGGREVEVSVGEHDGGVELLFTDYGCGIGEDERERVFELGYRSEMAKRFKVEGSGIGLWVARQLAKLNEGTLEVATCDLFDSIKSKQREPQPRYKVVFRLWLPVV
jgi:signal transduction histidine kinase